MSCSLCRPRPCKGHEVGMGPLAGPDELVRLDRLQALCAVVYQIVGVLRLEYDTVKVLDLLHAAAQGELLDEEAIWSLLPFDVQDASNDALKKEIVSLKANWAMDRVKISEQKFRIAKLENRLIALGEAL